MKTIMGKLSRARSRVRAPIYTYTDAAALCEMTPLENESAGAYLVYKYTENEISEAYVYTHEEEKFTKREEKFARR